MSEPLIWGQQGSGGHHPPTLDRKDAPPTLEELYKTYSIWDYTIFEILASIVFGIGVCISVLAALLSIDAIEMPEMIAQQIEPYLPLGLILTAAGLSGITIDAVRKRAGNLGTATVKRDFIRFLFNQSVFPAGFSKRQFRVRVKNPEFGNQYYVDFDCRIPGYATQKELEPVMAKVAACFACADTFMFWENRSEKRGCKYRFRLTLMMDSPEEIWARAGERDGKR
ncbi:MAG: hypothetical protein E7Z99_03315 [Coriobacteriaceae bacterium]|nr:hypothetical protein [Coriobacteriaceae bacterium]